MPPELPPNLLAVIEKYWGFRELRPLQAEAMRAVLAKRDSMVVMPTGGGKSLCFQAPAIALDGLTVVVSPLIALMKDQVDGLKRNGIEAVRLDSTLTNTEVNAAVSAIRSGGTKLAFISPERLVNTSTYQMLRDARAQTVAIDEAHCISHWGHDFRPEYRMLAKLREFFPGASIHAYTATATEQVRKDIIAQLNLRNAEVHVGNFDRPNLTFRVLPQSDVITQIREVLDRHKNQAGIVYCLRRSDVDEMTQALKRAKYKVVPYHAGMTPEDRKRSHDAFASEAADIVVATIAFGMGIDRSNVRFVIHACVPKTIEHYQQETGRAGRDGLPSECVLFYSQADVIGLQRIMIKSAEERNTPADYLNASLRQLEQMKQYANKTVCRHRSLVQHFGQSYDKPNCQACDICLSDTEELPDSTLVAQKILSCVARVNENFGVNHVIDVLRGANTEAIRGRGHDTLSTYGLLKSLEKTELRDYIYQLVGQDALVVADGQFPVLKLNDASWAIMRKQQTVRLIRRAVAKTTNEDSSALPAGSDLELFELLRFHRRELAQRSGMQPYQIFHDPVLAELARCRPTSLERMRLVSGVGDVKLREFGQEFLAIIIENSESRGLTTDLPPPHDPDPKAATKAVKMTTTKNITFELFRLGYNVEDVVHQSKLASRTVVDHLAEFIQLEKPESITTWVPDELRDRVIAAAKIHGTARLKPVYLELKEEVPYDTIRIVFAWMSITSSQ